MRNLDSLCGRLLALTLASSSALGACTDAADNGASSAPITACTGNCGGGEQATTPLYDAGLPGTQVVAPAVGTSPRSDAGTRTEAAKAPGQGLPCEIKSIVQGKCQLCHGESVAFSAPMSLVTHADFQAPGRSDASKKTHQLVKTRINTTVVAQHMPPTTSTQLTASELAGFNTWLDQGAPASDQSCAVPAGDAGVTGTSAEIDVSGLECHKILAHAEGNKAAKYKVGAATDAYVLMGFKAPWQGTVYGIVMRPVIDNTKALHHWLLYKEAISDGSIQSTIGNHPAAQMIFGWAPGGPDYDFRKVGDGDGGFELDDSTYSLELHYNSSDPNAMDASGIEVCVQKTKPKNVAGLTWLGYDNGDLLASTSGLCLEPSTTWTGTCVPTSKEPIHILQVTPHLHQTGRHLKSVINGPNGTRILHDEPFDFAYQRSYAKNETLMPGETITTTCTFSEPQCFGQATTAEMCYLFTYAYPKGALTDDGPWGAFAHGEGTCLGQ